MNPLRSPLPILLAALSLLPMLAGCSSTPPAGPDRLVEADATRDTAAARSANARGLTLLEAGSLEAAEAAFRQALEADMFFGPAHNNLGKVHYQRRELYPAARRFDHAAKLMPHRPEPHNNLGLVFEAAGRYEQAADAYVKARDMEQDNPEFLGNLARVQIRQGERGEAVRELLNELILKDDRPQWVNWAREQLATLGQTREPQEVRP